MVALSCRDPGSRPALPQEPRSGSRGWHTTYGEVRVYRPGPGGAWTATTYKNVASPALRGDCLTLVEARDGRQWIKQWWGDRGQCLFFGESQVLVRAAD